RAVLCALGVSSNTNVIGNEATDIQEDDRDRVTDDSEQELESGSPLPARIVMDIVSVSLGCSYGRWDIRSWLVQRKEEELSDPFETLPHCPPAMLQDEYGEPVRGPRDGYPIDVNYDGIIFDDPERHEDVVRRLREVLELVWTDRAEAVENEACDLLGVQ